MNQEINPVKHARVIIDEVSKMTDSCLVGYSGGKDSRVLLDLIVESKKFKRVLPYYLYFIKGLRYDQHVSVFPRERYGIEVLWYPHTVALYYAQHKEKYDDIKMLGHDHIHQKMRADTGAEWICQGWKRADGMFRRLTLKNYELQGIQKSTKKFYPITSFKKQDIFNYMLAKRIPAPEMPTVEKKVGSGLGIEKDKLLYLKSYFPDDYEKIKHYFPFVDIALKHQEFYGDKKKQASKIQHNRDSQK